MLSHHSPFFHSLLLAHPTLSQYTIPHQPSCTAQHLLLLLQTLYCPLPPSPPASSASSAAFAFSPQQLQLIPHLHPLLMLSHQLQLPVLLSSLSCLFSLMLRRHLYLHPAPSLSFLLDTLLLSSLYGLVEVSAVVESAIVDVGGDWWEGQDWAGVKCELDVDIVERMERMGRECAVRRAAEKVGPEKRLTEVRRGVC